MSSTGGSNTIESAVNFLPLASVNVGSDDALVLAGAVSGANGMA